MKVGGGGPCFSLLTPSVCGYSYAKDWSVILKVLVCSETLVKALPALQGTEDKIDRLSRNCFHKIHVRKLQLESVIMAAQKG